MLVVEFLAQLVFLVLQLLELRIEVSPDKEVAGQQRHDHETDGDRAGADRQRPATRIARIECAQLLQQIHLAPPPWVMRLDLAGASSSSSPLAAISPASSTKLLPTVLPGLLSTTSSSGSFIHCEPEMLRINVDTRVEDCATPSNLRCLPSCLKLVR